MPSKKGLEVLEVLQEVELFHLRMGLLQLEELDCFGDIEARIRTVRWCSWGSLTQAHANEIRPMT